MSNKQTPLLHFSSLIIALTSVTKAANSLQFKFSRIRRKRILAAAVASVTSLHLIFRSRRHTRVSSSAMTIVYHWLQLAVADIVGGGGGGSPADGNNDYYNNDGFVPRSDQIAVYSDRCCCCRFLCPKLPSSFFSPRRSGQPWNAGNRRFRRRCCLRSLIVLFLQKSRVVSK